MDEFRRQLRAILQKYYHFINCDKRKGCYIRMRNEYNLPNTTYYEKTYEQKS